MALNKPIQNAQGYSPEYHRIVSVSFIGNGKAMVAITSHKDEDARRTGKAHAETQYIKIDAPADATRQELYELIKATDMFTGSSDV